MRRSTYNENELQTLLTQEYNPFADGLSSAMIKLGHARNELLRTAACNMDDSSSLREAGVAYRSSILEFREAIAILRQNVGPDVANQIVGEQMQQAMPFSQRMLLAEISGDLNPIQPEE
jgi:hypothetical protein